MYILKGYDVNNRILDTYKERKRLVKVFYVFFGCYHGALQNKTAAYFCVKELSGGILSQFGWYHGTLPSSQERFILRGKAIFIFERGNINEMDRT